MKKLKTAKLPFHRLPRRARRPQRGFSLIEMLISLTVSVLILVSVLTLFDANARLSRVQTDVAEIQQAQRVAQHDLTRMVRMVGRGGLPGGPMPQGLALGVRNNAGESEYVSLGDSNTPEVLEGTDVLTVRGVFTAPVYQVAYRGAGQLVLDTGNPATASTGTLFLTDPSNTGIHQDLSPIIQAVNDNRPEALIVVSPLSDQTYAVVQLDPANSNVTNPDNIQIGFWVRGGPSSAAYDTLSAGGAYPNALGNVAYLGILEEYRYYIRERWVDGQPEPSLFRARVYPGTETPHPADGVPWGLEVAGNVFDLQVTLGFDNDGDQMVADGSILDTVTPDADEWLYNHPDDNTDPTAWAGGQLYFTRVTSMVRTDRPDRRYQAPQLVLVEDHAYAGSPFNSEAERTHRRRTVQTLVDMRNLS